MRLEHLPRRGVLPGFKRRRAAQRGQRIAEEQPLAPALILPAGRMSLGQRRGLGRGVGFFPDGAKRLEVFLRVVPDTETPFVNLQVIPNLHIRRDQMRRAVLVRQTFVGRDPGRTAARHLGHAAWLARGVAEIIQFQAQRRLEGSQWMLVRRRAGAVENPQRITRNGRIAPQPEEPPAMYRVLDGVRTKHARLAPVEFTSELLALGENSAARDAPQTLRNDRAVHFHPQRAARLGFQAHTAHAESILRHAVAVSVYLKPHLAPHQFRRVERNDPGVVRDIA